MGKEESEWGGDEWRKAQALMSAGRTPEAVKSLLEAEQSFRTSGQEEKLLEVLIAEGRLNIFLGDIPLALEKMIETTDLAKRLGDQNAEACAVFQRGLAYLLQGEENLAHRDLTRYLELTEAMRDESAQARGHFYLALTYERHGEPCMATAELELGRDVAKNLDSPLARARMTAVLAHLWMARGVASEGETLIKEAYEIIKDSRVTGTSSMGLILLADAELKAFNSDWKGSKSAFQHAIQIFRATNLGHFYEGMAYDWYGGLLISRGKKEEGRQLLSYARSVFENISNMTQAEKVVKRMTD